MARPGVTYLDVSKATQELIRKGKSPTVESVRALLGTGSNGTIGTHLRAWREKQDPANQLLLQSHLPEELISLMKGLWERVIAQAESQVEAVKQETQQKITQLKEKGQHLEQENHRWQQQANQIKQERDALIQEKIALEELLYTNKTEKVALQTKQEGLLQQLEEKQTRIHELHRQNEQVQANLEHYRAASLEQRQQEQQRFEQQQRILEQESHTLRDEVTRLQKQNIIAEQSLKQLQFQKNHLQEEFDKKTIGYEVTSTKLNKSNQLLAQETNSKKHWQSQCAIVSEKLEEQQQLNVELKTQLLILSQEIKTYKSSLSEITAQNKSLIHDKWILGQEKAQILGQFKQLEAVIR